MIVFDKPVAAVSRHLLTFEVLESGSEKGGETRTSVPQEAGDSRDSRRSRDSSMPTRML
jgi:hypothetical protein